MQYTSRVKKIILILVFVAGSAKAQVVPGIEVFFQERRDHVLQEKHIGLIVNQTSVDRNLHPTPQLFLDHGLHVVALFSPEHGLEGQELAETSVADKRYGRLPVYSLYGKTRRPTTDMLRGIDVLVYDIQCIGSRSYTYPSALFYAMEEAAKTGIEVFVLDRPNPINGLTIDGPLLEERWRSYIGYVNVPYCHGMTIGELAKFFNEEYRIGCKLTVIPMQGWKRSMTYRDTGLPWIPPSPYIPEPDTPLFYPSTGLLSGLRLFNIGIGYTLPFKIVGAPWIQAEKYAAALNAQKLPGVRFLPFHFKPFYGAYKGEACGGVLIQATNPLAYRPVSVQYAILGVAKSLYPKEFARRLPKGSTLSLFHQAHGTDAIFRMLSEERYPMWKLIQFQRDDREAFRLKRQKYLLPNYESRLTEK